MPVEVGVNLEKVTCATDMNAASDEVRVRHEVLDAGQRFEKQNELARVQLSEHFSESDRQLGLVVLVAPPIVHVVALNPGDVFRAREGVGQPSSQFVLQKVVEDAVGKG